MPQRKRKSVLYFPAQHELPQANQDYNKRHSTIGKVCPIGGLVSFSVALKWQTMAVEHRDKPHLLCSTTTSQGLSVAVNCSVPTPGLRLQLTLPMSDLINSGSLELK